VSTGHQHHRLLAVPRSVVGIGLAHDDVDLAARIAAPLDHHFGAVDDVIVFFALDSASGCSSASEDATFGSVMRKSRADPALEQRLAPFA
jgi:hypothetical protein